MVLFLNLHVTHDRLPFPWIRELFTSATLTWLYHHQELLRSACLSCQVMELRAL